MIYYNDLNESVQNEIAIQVGDFNNISNEDILHFTSKINEHHQYSLVAARLLAEQLKQQVYDYWRTNKDEYFEHFIDYGVSHGILDPRMSKFNLSYLNDNLDYKRMQLFNYIGLKTLVDRYLIKDETGQVIELPQTFFMRVSMGLNLNYLDKDVGNHDASLYAKLLYDEISYMRYMPSTPTLFNSGTTHSQLSSCFVSTIDDSLESIYVQLKNNAHISKYAGGIGTDWTNVRATGSYINGTQGASQGVIPFMKVYNDTLIAVNQGGKRRGSGVAYLEPWHADIYQFLAARKGTGDDRLRLHDMNTALWVPDLFMERVKNDADWTLFDPAKVPHLHTLYGDAFEKAYVSAERKLETLAHKKVKARDLWKLILNTLHETGHPWITFKDTFNKRNPQAHCGVIRSSNLCTEIGLNTSSKEIAVCNLGSINLTKFVENGRLNTHLLEKTVNVAIKALNDVIDLNFHVVSEAKEANKKHRAIGLGAMGFHSMLQQNGISYGSEEAVKLNSKISEYIQYYAMNASCELAIKEKPYDSFKGSTWSRGLLTHDTYEKLNDRYKLMYSHNLSYYNGSNELAIPEEWYQTLREKIMRYGIRNSNLTAIAPTATISNVCGVSQSYEPIYSNIYTKSNLSGEFMVINPEMVKYHEEKGTWNDETKNKLYETNGESKDELFETAFHTNPYQIIKLAAARQKFIDQSQSVNLYFDDALWNGDDLHDWYVNAHTSGMKSTYYLRTKAASKIEYQTTQDKVNTVCNLEEGCESCQ